MLTRYPVMFWIQLSAYSETETDQIEQKVDTVDNSVHMHRIRHKVMNSTLILYFSIQPLRFWRSESHLC